MKNKWLIIGIAVVVIIAGILIAVNAGGETSVSQPATPTVSTPTEPTESTPVQTPPVVTDEPVPAGVIEITVEKLVSDLLVNPDKYKKGTVFQVSGVFIWEQKLGLWPYKSAHFFLGPAVSVDNRPFGGVWITVHEKEKEAFATFNALGKDNGKVVVRGTYYFFSARQGVSLENCSLISVTPTE